MFQQLGAENGFDVDIWDPNINGSPGRQAPAGVSLATSPFLDLATLKQYKTIVFELDRRPQRARRLNATEFANLQAYVRGGGGVIAIHGGTDSMQNVPWYMDLVGAGFTNHGSNQGGILIDTESGGHVELVNADPAHTTTAAMPDRFFTRRGALQHQPQPGRRLGIVHPLVYENEDSLIGQLGYGTGALHEQRPARDDLVPQLRRRPLLHDHARPQLAVHDRDRGSADDAERDPVDRRARSTLNCVTFNEVRDLLAADLAAAKITQAGADALNAKLDEAEAAKEAGLIQRSLGILDQFVNIAKKPSTSAAPTEACPNACLKDAREELAFKGRELKDWIKGFK